MHEAQRIAHHRNVPNMSPLKQFRESDIAVVEHMLRGRRQPARDRRRGRSGSDALRRRTRWRIYDAIARAQCARIDRRRLPGYIGVMGIPNRRGAATVSVMRPDAQERPARLLLIPAAPAGARRVGEVYPRA